MAWAEGGRTARAAGTAKTILEGFHFIAESNGHPVRKLNYKMVHRFEPRKGFTFEVIFAYDRGRFITVDCGAHGFS
jgi:hypothetical protein